MYQIGAFSKICQVSVKTLRHYDRIGLLKPAEVDASTGYRYYDRSQLEQMLLIQKLKRYGFSLEEILFLLRCEDGAVFHAELLRQKEKLQWQQMEQRTILQELILHLQDLERTGSKMENRYTVTPVDTAAIPVISCRQRMSVEDFGQHFGRLFERIAKERFTPSGVVGAMYYDEEFDRDSSDIELFVGIRESEKADRTIPSQLCAMTLHRGFYSTLPEAYAALVSWIEEKGYLWNGAPYEVYTKSGGDGIPPEEWETEIYFPIRHED